MRINPVALATLTLLGALSSAAMAQSRSTYIVQLAAEPAATYAGNVAGLAATKAAPGTRFDSRSAAVSAYRAYLNNQQNAVVALIGNAPVIARYNTVYNGFAARLTRAEVQALLASPLVASVQADEARAMDTVSTHKFLGLSTSGGVWSQTVAGLPLKGEDIIIGVVDGGVWPESLAYADRVDTAGVPVFSGGASAYGPPPAGWMGTCQAGEGFNPALHCNNKLIGAQYFKAGFQAYLDSGQTRHWTEFFSPRDSVAGPTGHGGHGSHTSSTAGGNANTPAVLGGATVGAASGMAPRARIAAYKVCYTWVNPAATDGTGSSNSCFNSDSVAAIDKAVADGVHVINFSISGSQTSVADPVEQAFMRAAAAGVFVAASAGNAGPANAVAHISPWLTTVAASTHDRGLFLGDVTLASGTKYSGASVNATPLASTDLIRAEDAGITGATSTLNLCFSSPNQLDPAKVAGKIVICTRGTNARIDKSLAVKNAGGVGMVLADNGSGLIAEAHSVPTVHVSQADGVAIKAYAQAAGAKAAISAFYSSVKPAPIMAGFSSRGPNRGDANMLKPDLTAPGVDVIATVTPGLSQAERDQVATGTLVPPTDWAAYNGTSMSSPHVAGLAALFKQAHPTWSPAAIKSALMTTATPTLNDGLAGLQNGLLPWAQGAGHVAPGAALDPGLVYDAGNVDFIRYQCKVNKAAVTPASDCTTYGTLDETYNYNLPSITVGNITNNVTVTRKVTNVGTSAATYTASANVPGFSALVTPSALTLGPGETKSFTLKLTATTAVLEQWNYGSLTWTDGVHVVRSPVTARTGKSITAPASFDVTTTSGSKMFTIKTGFSGRPSANKGGMKPVTMGATATLSPNSNLTTVSALANACIAGNNPAVKPYPVAIPAGGIVARFALRDADVGAAGDDNDMFVLTPSGGFLYSGNVNSNESVEIVNPAAGNYLVCVHAYAGGASMSHRLSSWVVTTADASSSLNVMLPGQVYIGGTATVGLSWSGLATGNRYMGGVQFKDAGGTVQATTVVRADLSGGAPAPAQASGAKVLRD